MTILNLAPLASDAVHAADSPRADYPIEYVPSKQVQITDFYWARRLETNRTVTIPHLLKMNDENERLNNLRRGAGLLPGPYVSRRYNDTDVYKLIEAIGYSLMMHPDPALEKIADEQIDIIAKAQKPDGYLYPARMDDPKDSAPGVGPERWSREGGSHELYNHGHMIEAAVAYSQATGKKKFLEVAIKAADLLCNTFGPDKRHDTSGHEEIELALVKLYRATGQQKYLDLSRFFIDQRGQKHTFGDYGDDAPAGFQMYNDRPYRQDDKPVVEQTIAEGHAVRASYLYSGLTDVAALTGMQPYIQATDRLWNDVVGAQMYITGGIGSTGGTEAFGGDYFLPNNAYCESCAQIGNALWNERLFQLHGDAKYLDVMERIVYNGLLSGVSLQGDTFFYQNPLQQGPPRGGRRGGGRRGGARAGATATTTTQARAGAAAGARAAVTNAAELGGTAPSAAPSGPRQPWFDVACCPANLARFVAQFPGYIYATRGDVVYVDFFVGSEADLAVGGRKLHIKQETLYPRDGDTKITLQPEAAGEFTVNVRIPGWAQGNALPTDLYTYQPIPKLAPEDVVRLKLNGNDFKFESSNGFASIRRAWKKGDTIELHLPMTPRQVVANEKVEADRGLAAIERGPLVYCAEGIDNGGSAANLALAPDAKLTAEFKPDLLGGVTVITATSGNQKIVAVPYYAWGNRGNGEMRVWLSRPGTVSSAQ